MKTNYVYVFLPRELLADLCGSSVQYHEPTRVKSTQAKLAAPAVEKSVTTDYPAWTWFMENPRPQAH